MEKENIRLAFLKVKQDIDDLKNEIGSLKQELSDIKNILNYMNDNYALVSNANNSPTDTPTHSNIYPTIDRYPTDTPTLPQEIGGLKTQKNEFSIGNEGVPTDRQIYRQTNQQTDNSQLFGLNKGTYIQNPFPDSPNIESHIKKASEAIYSLENVKNEIRQKFKQITNQEMLVFSTIYDLEDKDPTNNTYKNIALILNLSETSIRDYTHKMIKKGIPINKTKVNNRLVILSISPELRKIASLATLINLKNFN